MLSNAYISSRYFLIKFNYFLQFYFLWSYTYYRTAHLGKYRICLCVSLCVHTPSTLHVVHSVCLNWHVLQNPGTVTRWKYKSHTFYWSGRQRASLIFGVIRLVCDVVFILRKKVVLTPTWPWLHRELSVTFITSYVWKMCILCFFFALIQLYISVLRKWKVSVSLFR